MKSEILEISRIAGHPSFNTPAFVENPGTTRRGDSYKYMCFLLEGERRSGHLIRIPLFVPDRQQGDRGILLKIIPPPRFLVLFRRFLKIYMKILI